jgi:glycosyltransferase involved in cell wall biosynthesis
MTFAIITHVPHILAQNQFVAYAPYVQEMNIWGKQVTELIVVAPLVNSQKTAVDSSYNHPYIRFLVIDTFDVLRLKGLLRAIIKIPKISWQIYKAMHAADHIHLRCPGNIGLLGCLIQIAFPSKPKTAKYAGNWDPKSKQPWTYKVQQWILSNTFLTRNIQVLVYGEWEGSTANIKPFFTATYTEADKVPIANRNIKELITFVFVGALVTGKNPLYAMQLIERLHHIGYSVRLTIYGEGVQRKTLEDYIAMQQLEFIITLKGNQTKENIQKAYQNSHFVVLPSNSEGWPKVIAEGMFWGCVAIATKVSCVPYMLDDGNRGLLLHLNLENDILQIETILNDQSLFDSMQIKGSEWSRGYTMDVFEAEINKLLLDS